MGALVVSVYYIFNVTLKQFDSRRKERGCTRVMHLVEAALFKGFPARRLTLNYIDGHLQCVLRSACKDSRTLWQEGILEKLCLGQVHFAMRTVAYSAQTFRRIKCTLRVLRNGERSRKFA